MPIQRSDIQKVVASYNPKKITIGILGSHSALELGMSTKAMGARNVVVVEQGRDEIYRKDHRHLYDHVIVVEHFKDILSDKVI